MSLQPQLVAPFQTGLVQSIEPWLAPDDGLDDVINFHVHNGYLEKRNGHTLFGYMIHSTANSSGTTSQFGGGMEISSITNAIPAVVTTVNPFSATLDFPIGTKVLFNNVSGMESINNQIFTITAINVVAQTITLDNTELFEAAGTGGRIAKYVGFPITGIFKSISTNGTIETYIFDTNRVNVYSAQYKFFSDVGLNTQYMDGNYYDFVWVSQWRVFTNSNSIIYFTNGIPFDHDNTGAYDGNGYNGIFQISAYSITSLNPIISETGAATEFKMIGCKIIFPFQGRLVALYTYEAETADIQNTTEIYPQRIRYSATFNPTSWREDVNTGGFNDAPTSEHIVSARPLKDFIIVFFTNSVWAIRPTPDPAEPFVWYRLNNFRACDGKMASVGYDQYAISIGKRGIHGTDFSATQRIDSKIENFVSEDINTDDFANVFCERNYEANRWWTLYPRQAGSEDEKSQGVLVFDDDSKAYTKYDLSLNCLGHGQLEYDYTFADFTVANGLDYTFNSIGESTFSDPKWQSKSEVLLGGDFDGSVYVLDSGQTDLGVVIDAYLKTVNWAPFKDQGIESQMSYIDIYADSAFDTKGEIGFYKDNDEDPYDKQKIDLLPDLGYIASIENITQANPAVVTAPGHNLSTGDEVYIYLVEGMTDINALQYTITVIDNNSFSLDGIDSSTYSAYNGDGLVVERQFYKTKVWKRAYAGGIGYEHAIDLTVTGTNENLRIHAFKPYFKPRGRRTIN